MQTSFYFKQIINKQENTRDYYARITDLICLFAFLEGLEYGMISMFKIGVNHWLLFTSNLLISFLFTAILYTKQKNKKIGFIIWIIVLALCMFLFNSWLTNGISLILNQIIDTIGKKFPYYFPTYKVTINKEFYIICVTSMIVLLSSCLCFLGGYLIEKGNKILLGIMLISYLSFQVITGIYSSVFGNILMIFVCVFTWMREHANKVNFDKQRVALLGQAGIVIFVMGVIVGVMQLIIPIHTYKKNAAILAFQNDIRERIDEKRYSGKSKVMPEGKFCDLSSLETSTDVVLEIKMSRPESYYLRGFMGSEYKGNRWEELDHTKSWKERNLFYWLHKDEFFGQTMLGNAGCVLDQKIEKEEKNSITINNINGNSRYAYTPYELLKIEDESVNLKKQRISDESLITEGWKGKRNYSVTATSNLVTKYPKLVSCFIEEDKLTKEGKKYQKLENNYNEFVYKNYLDIPGNLKIELKKLLGKYKITEGQKHLDYAEAKENIIYFLNAKCQYSNEISDSWNGTDFVYEFLTRSKKGYSVHYASSAALIFRYYGIPARYVEGYLVTPEDVKTMKPDTPYQIDETHAHAWVEYYQDGVGWLPFEVTPSYMDIMGKAESYKDISEISGQSSGSQQILSEEEENEENEENKSKIDWQVILKWVLISLIIIMLGILIYLFGWVLYQRYKWKKIKRLFDDADYRIAVRSMFHYIMNVLSATGLEIHNQSLFNYDNQIENLFDKTIVKEFNEVVNIRQEAVYSNHKITEEQKKIVMNFKNKIWCSIYKYSGLLQRIKLKLIYFL